MAKSLVGPFAGDIRPILGAIRSVRVPVKPTLDAPPLPAPFVTISREPGVDSHAVAQRLVERLNAVDPGEQPWTAWDRELVEKVAADLSVSQRLVESLEQATRGWLADLLEGMCISDPTHVDEVKVYRKVVTTIRALAHVGRVVLVGRGAVYVTADMPGGVHIRLTAAPEYRVGQLARSLKLSQADAARELDRQDRSRQAFLKRYWPDHYRRTDLYHAILNMALVSVDRAADAIQQLPVLSVAAAAGG